MTPPLPRYVQLYPTTRCNQRCTFCFNARLPQMEDLSFSQALRLLEILDAHGIGEIDVMGGEPLLLPWIANFAECAVKKGFRLNISTNGSMPEVLGSFSGIDPKKLTIGVSLEGSNEREHRKLTTSDHFAAAVVSINTLVSLGFEPVVKTVVDGTTMQGIQKIVELVRHLGVTRFCVIHRDFLDVGRNAAGKALSYPDFLTFYRGLKQKNPGIEVLKVHASCFDSGRLPAGSRCAAAVLKFSVLPDGTLFPCNLFHRFPVFRLGNIFSQDLLRLWTGPTAVLFRDCPSNRCRDADCPNRKTCTGGCPAHAYSFYRDINGPDIRCRRIKHIEKKTTGEDTHSRYTVP